jgi:hypothetical protein
VFGENEHLRALFNKSVEELKYATETGPLKAYPVKALVWFMLLLVDRCQESEERKIAEAEQD